MSIWTLVCVPNNATLDTFLDSAVLLLVLVTVSSLHGDEKLGGCCVIEPLP